MTSSQYRGPLLTLIRHGETEGNVAHIIQGQTDSPLSGRGRAQVLALGKHWRTGKGANRHLQSEDGKDDEQTRATMEKCLNGLPVPTVIITSPTGRARTTATAVYLACRELSVDVSFLEDGMIDQASTVPTLSLSTSARSSERELESNSALTTNLVLDPLLMELDFGSREGTRRGMHVPGFPKSSSPGESRETFARRLRDAGECWLRAAGMPSDTVNRFGRSISAVAKDGKSSRDSRRGADKGRTGGEEVKQAAKETIRLESQMQGESLPETEGDDFETGTPARKRQRTESASLESEGTTAAQTPVAVAGSSGEPGNDAGSAAQAQVRPAHVVLVTHGMAISTFLTCFQPAMDKSSSGVIPSSYPFPSNTGYFTMGIRPIQRLSTKSTDKSKASSFGQLNTDKMELFLLRANETAHLAAAGLGGSPRRGVGKQEQGLQSISSFFSKK
ncbi:hypothetical protein OC861_003870 [Tilletia horrida]|nr:hypothetical protein OC861_003870 [Tilletia horrida]